MTVASPSLGLHKHRKGASVPHDSPLRLAGLFRTGTGALRYTGMLDDRSLAIYQHQYMIFAGTTTVPVLHSIYLVEVSPLWPKIVITRRSLTGRIAHRLGRRRGLQLDDPQFNAVFKVDCENDDFAIALLTPDLQRFLLTKRDVIWRIDLGRLALLYRGKLREKRMAASLDRLRRFFQHIPPELENWS